MALGYSVALGFCMVFGTLIPPLYNGLFQSAEDWENLVRLCTTGPGISVLLGIVCCFCGIILCGLAGMCKERELTETQKRESVQEFAIGKGFAVATASGILSACFAFGLAAGAPIQEASIDMGTSPVFSNNAVLVVILIGGFLSNVIWCLIINARNKTFRDYVSGTVAQ